MNMRVSLKELPPKMREQAVKQLAIVSVRTVSSNRPRLPEHEKPLLGKFKPQKPRRAKYNAQRVELQGIWFDSLKEARRWGELRLMERGGLISDLQHHVLYDLVVDGVRICKYEADFQYRDGDKLCVEDVKGYRGGAAYRVFKMKAALMKVLHGIKVIEK